MTESVLDVLIIGGGLSGLAAGNYLYEHGEKNFIILEGRDRVGGRTWTINHKNHSVDVGGAYVGPFQNRILRLAREFGIQTYRIDNKGTNILRFSNGRRLEYSTTIPTPIGIFNLLDLNYLLCRTQELCEQISNLTPWSNTELMNKFDSMNVEVWLDSLAESNEAKEIYRAALRTITCVEPSELSMFAWLTYINNGCGIMRLCEVENGAQERKFVGGSQQISDRLCEKLGTDRVLLNHAVQDVHWSPNGEFVQVMCENNRQFTCRHVIIALAPSLYKTINFQPALPDKKLEATQRMYMGSIIKTITVFDRPYWKEAGFSGSILNTAQVAEPVVFSYDDSTKDKQFYALMGFVVADSSRKWAQHTREERRLAVCEQYAQAFHCPEMLTGCRDYIEQNWCDEKFSGGCYTDIMPPNLLSSLKDQLRTPCGDHGQILFAGTELATRFSGYMDGAVQAGERAAYDLLDKYLQRENLREPLTWVDDEPVDDREDCRPHDVNQWMYGPSKIEMLLPRSSTVRNFLRIGTVIMVGLIAYTFRSRLSMLLK